LECMTRSEREVERMAEWKLVDAWELGYEYECSNCGCHIDTKRKGEALPGVCPLCDSDMNGNGGDPR
jgi:hypothetical protein